METLVLHYKRGKNTVYRITYEATSKFGIKMKTVQYLSTDPKVIWNELEDYKYHSKEWQDDWSLILSVYKMKFYDYGIGKKNNTGTSTEMTKKHISYGDVLNDLTQLATDVVLLGSESQKAFAELQKSVSEELSLSMDNNGNVTYTQNSTGPLTADATQLVNAIDDHSITVNVTAENTKVTSEGTEMLGGAFMGNTVTNDLLIKPDRVSTSQEINPNILETISTYYEKPGADTLHEVTESYQGGKIAQEAGYSTPSTTKPRGMEVYNSSHDAATPPSGGVFFDYRDSEGNDTGEVLYKNGSATYSVQDGKKAPQIIQTYP
ncbi:MAG: hypothetical protein E2604_13195 [Flavobacterium sp.]|nr:hypothetical protein [Flavobacterium sp.]